MADLAPGASGTRRIIGARGHAPVAVALVLGVALSVGCFLVAGLWERAHTQAEFERRVRDLGAAVQRDVHANLGVVRSVADFPVGIGQVRREQFRPFVRRALGRHRDIRALEWAPREALRGFVVGVFLIGDLIRPSLGDIETEGIAVHVYDEATLGADRPLHAYASRGWGVAAQRSDAAEAEIRAGLHWVMRLDVAGRQWSLLFYATPR